MGDLIYTRLIRLGTIPSAQAEEFQRCFDIRMSRRPTLQPLNNGACETAVLIPEYWPRVQVARMKIYLQAWLDASAALSRAPGTQN